MEGEHSEGRTEERGHREGGRLRWGRIFYYFMFVLLAGFAWYLFFGFVYELVGAGLALNAVMGISWIAVQVVAFAVLAYRTRERPLAHVLLLALLVWLVSLFFAPWVSSFAGWLINGILTAVWALAGFGVGIGLRALRERSR